MLQWQAQAGHSVRRVSRGEARAQVGGQAPRQGVHQGTQVRVIHGPNTVLKITQAIHIFPISCSTHIFIALDTNVNIATLYLTSSSLQDAGDLRLLSAAGRLAQEGRSHHRLRPHRQQDENVRINHTFSFLPRR